MIDAPLIRVTQVVDEMTDSDDRAYMPAGEDFNGAHKDYSTHIENAEEALDEFASRVAISLPEEFSVEFVPSRMALLDMIHHLQARVNRLEQGTGIGLK